MENKLTLKDMAAAGYIMGLPTIGHVADHRRSHHYAYFHTDNLAAEMAEFDALVDGHEEESIFKYLTTEEKKQMDDELEKALSDGSNTMT